MNYKKIIAREFLFLLGSALLVLALISTANYKFKKNVRNERKLLNLIKIESLPKRLRTYEVTCKIYLASKIYIEKNNDAINDLYKRAISLGYKKTKEEFRKLLYNNKEVFNDMFSYFQQNGYKKTVDEFAILIGKNRVNLKRVPVITGYPDKKSFIEKLKDEKIASEFYDLTKGYFYIAENKSLFLKSVKDDKDESEKTILKISELEENIKNYKTSILFMYSLNSTSLFENIIGIIFLILFLIRYVIYVTVWSIKQLKK